MATSRSTANQNAFFQAYKNVQDLDLQPNFPFPLTTAAISNEPNENRIALDKIMIWDLCFNRRPLLSKSQRFFGCIAVGFVLLNFESVSFSQNLFKLPLKLFVNKILWHNYQAGTNNCDDQLLLWNCLGWPVCLWRVRGSFMIVSLSQCVSVWLKTTTLTRQAARMTIALNIPKFHLVIPTISFLTYATKVAAFTLSCADASVDIANWDI